MKLYETRWPLCIGTAIDPRIFLSFVLTVGMWACHGNNERPIITIFGDDTSFDMVPDDDHGAGVPDIIGKSDVVLQDKTDIMDFDANRPQVQNDTANDAPDNGRDADIGFAVDTNSEVSSSTDIVVAEDTVGDSLPTCQGDSCGMINTNIWVTAGDHHTCVLRDDGNVGCVGYNWWGALGNGDVQTTSITLSLPVGLPSVTQNAAGDDFSCALDGESHVWCWGINVSGQAGSGKFSWAQPIPGEVVKLAKTDWIAAGGPNAGALTSDGVAYMWGKNVQGQLGNGTTQDSATPQKVLSNVLFSDLEIGYLFACGVAKQGTVYCWGSNGDGNLGTGGMNIDGIHTPVQVIGLADAIQVTSGSGHSCVIRKTGTVKCWGQGKWGQLGDGTFINSYTPGTVSGLEEVIDIAAGTIHTCAVLQGGTVWCWGNNNAGQLGDGSTQPSPVPIRAKGVNDAIQVTCGAAHTCALRKNGTVMCWGSNKDGQLGTGTKESSLVPIPAAALN